MMLDRAAERIVEPGARPVSGLRARWSRFRALFNTRRVMVYRLMFLIVLTSSVITLVATSLQLLLAYRDDVNRLHMIMEQIEIALLPSLSDAIWTYNGVQVQTQIDGWVQTRDIEFLQVTSEHETWTVGKVTSDNVITHGMDIVHTALDQPLKVGRIEIVANLDHAVQRVLDTAVFILVSNGIKTLMVSTVIVLIFQMLVSRHIFRMSDYVQKFSTDDDFVGLELQRSRFEQARRDELDDFAQDISDMCLRLHKDFSAVEKSASQYRDYADAAADWFWETDADGRVTFVSERYLELSSKRFAEVAGKTVAQLRWLGRQGATGRIATGRSGDPVPFHNLIDWRNFGPGVRRCVRSSGVPVFDADGNFAGYRCVSVDVTEEMMKRKDLTMRRKEFMESMQNMPYAVAWFDEHDRLSFQNKLFEMLQERMLGRTVQSVTFENLIRYSLTAGLIPDAKGLEEEWVAQRLRQHKMPGAAEKFRLGRGGGELFRAQEFRTPNGGTLLILQSIGDRAPESDAG